MAEVDDIRRQLSGVTRTDENKTRVKRERSKKTTTRTQVTPRKQPPASERSSIVAQEWYDRAVDRGFNLPYNANYLALAIQDKIQNDPRMRKFLAAGRADDVLRWAQRMVSNWWDFYVDEDITQSNAKDYFLGNDWEDLRDWALDNLKSEYNVKHGKRIPPPLYPNQQDYRRRLEDIDRQQAINRWLDTHPEQVSEDAPRLDPKAHERLRSWSERQKQKRREREQER